MGNLLDKLGINVETVRETVKRIILNEHELDTAITFLLLRNRETMDKLSDECNYYTKYARAFSIKWDKNSMSPLRVSINEVKAPDTSLYTIAKLTFTVGRNSIDKITNKIKESEIEEILESNEEIVELSSNGGVMVKKKLSHVLTYSLSLQYVYYRLYSSFMYQNNEIYKAINIGFPRTIKGMELRKTIFLTAMEISYILSGMDKEFDCQ